MMTVSGPKSLFRHALPSALVLGVCLSLLSLCMAPASVAAAKEKDFDDSEGTSILLGKKSWRQWKAETDWDSYAGGDYRPAKAKVSRISRLVRSSKISFLIFAGSWCKDSETQLPMLMKLLGAVRVPPGSIELFGVDAGMKEPSGTAQSHGVINVPTLIVLKGQTELGRIVERPEETWEDDLLGILSR